LIQKPIPPSRKIQHASRSALNQATWAVTAIYPRAGDVPNNGLPVILPGLDTIDVTAIGDEFLGLNHTEFATNRAVMDDLKILLESRRRASRLTEIRAYPETMDGPHYWRYVP
jgi:hypothetical protein